MRPVARPGRSWKGTAPGMPIGWCRRSAICWVRCGSRCGSTTFTGLRVPRCPRRNASKCYSRRFPQWRRGPKDKSDPVGIRLQVDEPEGVRRLDRAAHLLEAAGIDERCKALPDTESEMVLAVGAD